MTFTELMDIVGLGEMGALAVIAYFMWRMDRSLTEFLAELRSERNEVNEKLSSIHNDINAGIRKIAGFNGQGENLP